jgi:hypothetical protein
MRTVFNSLKWNMQAEKKVRRIEWHKHTGVAAITLKYMRLNAVRSK